MKGSCLIWILSFLLFLIPVINAEPLCALNPDEIWLGKTSQITLECACPNSTTPFTDSAIGHFPLGEFGSDNKITFYIDEHRKTRIPATTYDIKVDCIDHSNGSVIIAEEILNLPVHIVTGRIVSPSSTNRTTIWDNQLFNIKYEINIDHEFIGGTPTPTFDIKVGGRTIDHEYIELREDNLWYIPIIIDFGELDNIDMNEFHDLEVTATYRPKDFDQSYTFYNSRENIIKFAQPFDVQLISPKDEISIINNEEQIIRLKITEQGQPLETGDLLKDNFDIRFEETGNSEKEIYITELSYDTENNQWILRLNLPILNEGTSGALNIETEHSGYSDSISIPVSYGMLFRGRIIKSNREIVKTRFKLIPKDKTRIIRFETDNKGYYSINITPGIYDLKIEMDPISTGNGLTVYGITVDIEDIEMNPDKLFPDPIRYDIITKDVSFNTNIDVAKLIVFEFALKSARASFDIKYDESRLDESNIKIYECSTWQNGNNNNNNNCEDWKETALVYHSSVSNFIGFGTTNLGTTAFAIGNEDNLKISAAADKDTYSAKETITITGDATNSNDNPVEDAKIYYYIENTNINGTQRTEPDGRYTIKISGINTEGRKRIMLYGTKDLYSDSDKIKIDIEITKKAQMSLIVPNKESPETIVTLDQESTLEFGIENTGDEDLTNIRFELNNLPTRRFSIEPYIIPLLPIGAKETIKINLNLTTDECINKCSTYYNVEIKGISDQAETETTSNNRFPLKIVQETDSKTANITQEQSTETQNDNTQVAPSKTKPWYPSGNSIINNSETTDIILIITFTIIAFIIISAKKKKRTGTRRSITGINKLKSLI